MTERLPSLLPARSLIEETSPRPDGLRQWNRKLLRSFFYTQMAGGLYLLGDSRRMDLGDILIFIPTSLPLVLLVTVPMDLASIRAAALWYGMKGIRPILNVLSLLVFYLVAPTLIHLFLLTRARGHEDGFTLLVFWAVIKAVLSAVLLFWWRFRTRRVMRRRRLPEQGSSRHR